LAELGILTPEEAMNALDTGRLPDYEQAKTDQEEYKTLRDKGFFQPLIGGAKQDVGEGKTGRPTGTGTPQLTKKISPIGAKASETFSLKKLVNNMKAAQDLGNEVASVLKLQFKKKKLSEDQLGVIQDITKVIIANEEPQKWQSAVGTYVKQPVDTNPARIKIIQDIAAEYQCDDYLASLLHISRNEESTPTENVK
jgi:hypothetical protein